MLWAINHGEGMRLMVPTANPTNCKKENMTRQSTIDHRTKLPLLTKDVITLRLRPARPACLARLPCHCAYLTAKKTAFINKKSQLR